MIPTSEYLSLVSQRHGAQKIHVHLTTLDTRGIAGPLEHSHEAEEAMYCLEGEAEYAVGDAVHRVGPGDCLFFPAGAPHGPRRFFSERMRYLVVRSIEADDGPCCCEQDLSTKGRP
jgi:uncharacterized cupin superfamily protein